MASVRAPWAPSQPGPWRAPHAGDSKAGPAAQPRPDRSGAATGQRGSPSTRHLHGAGNRNGLRLGWDVELQLCLRAHGQAGLRGAGERPCCSTPGAGAGMGSRAPGRGRGALKGLGWHRQDWGVLRALTAQGIIYIALGQGLDSEA